MPLAVSRPDLPLPAERGRGAVPRSRAPCAPRRPSFSFFLPSFLALFYLFLNRSFFEVLIFILLDQKSPESPSDVCVSQHVSLAQRGPAPACPPAFNPATGIPERLKPRSVIHAASSPAAALLSPGEGAGPGSSAAISLCTRSYL